MLKVRDDVAFKAIKNKAIQIVGSIPGTTDGVLVSIIGENHGPYKYRRRDLVNKPKKVTSWRVCPECGGRHTKIFIANSGKYRCQICKHEYDPPIR
jgi:rubredoxin